MLTKDGKPFGGVALDGVAMTGTMRAVATSEHPAWATAEVNV
jgi:hypothetical protein